MQQHQEEQLITERGQLFSAIQRPVKKSSEEQLFQPNAQKTIKFQTNIGHVCLLYTSSSQSSLKVNTSRPLTNKLQQSMKSLKDVYKRQE